jgi:transcriptional regulator with XRE-family HTH domain
MDTMPLIRLGGSLRDMRDRRSMTQAEVARLANVPRLKVIQVERGDPSVSMKAYAAIARALGAELTLTPSRRPTLEEARAFFSDGE